MKEGLNSLGIDWKGCKDKPEGRVIWLDLTTKRGMRDLKDILEANKHTLKIVFMSPPCGTASRAREIRRTKPDAFGKVIDPKPLRSDEHPDGLPDLGGIALEKVKSANILYENMIEIALWCDEHGVSWILENPSNSHIWETKAFKKLRELKRADKLKTPYERTQFQSCMHGGERPKKTDFMHAGIELEEFGIMCDGSHKHKPWGLLRNQSTFATAEERRYPRLLCRRLAARFAKVCAITRKRPVRDSSDYVAANKQPRRGEGNLLMVSQVCEEGKVVGGEIGSSQRLDAVGIPVGPVEGEDSVSPLAFLEKARHLTHPFDLPVKLAPSLAGMLCRMAALGPNRLRAYRKETLEWYTRRAEALREEEARLHSKLAVGVQQVVKDKRILLFKEMLRSIHYDDLGVVDLLVTGIKVVGNLPRLGIWQPEDRRAKIMVGAALHGAEEAKRAIQQCGTAKWSEVDSRLVECTLQELEDGHLCGPFSESQMNERLGSKVWLPARRFPIEQSDKLRPIEDFSEFGHNSAFGAEEKVTLKNFDTVVAVTRAWLEAESSQGVASFYDSAGKVWKADLSEEWPPGEFGNLVGRVADLKGAYKQLPCHAAHRCFSVIGLRREDGSTDFFEALSLMFGQTAAVYGFLRFSPALSAIASEIFCLASIEFFDDFTQVEPQLTCDSAMETMESFLDLLGWRISLGDKRLPFGKRFVSLGVVMELPAKGKMEITLTNKPGRVEAIKAAAEKVLSSDRLFGFGDALSFKGKFSFAEGQTFGRVLAPVSRVLYLSGRQASWHVSPQRNCVWPLRLAPYIWRVLARGLLDQGENKGRSLSLQMGRARLTAPALEVCWSMVTMSNVSDLKSQLLRSKNGRLD